MSAPQVSRTTKIVLIVEFVLLSYMLYVLSTSLYKSYEVDKFIQEGENSVQKLEDTNNMLAEDYQYYSSDAYKEKIAKQNFGLIRPGEEVIVLVKDAAKYESSLDRTTETTKQYYKSLNNPQKWFMFFFDRERFPN